MELTVEQRVRAVVVEELAVDVDALASDASLKTNLGADSMDAISLTLALEDEFQIEIPDRDAEQLTTIDLRRSRVAPETRVFLAALTADSQPGCFRRQKRYDQERSL